uniref:Secreted protein n=1 Tax=Capra hircus TaxID=9925 RepID=A0A8C2NV60_CAPHI
MRRGGLLEVALGFTVLLASYTSHGADTNLEAGNVKETRANRAKRRGGGGHDALKGSGKWRCLLPDEPSARHPPRTFVERIYISGNGSTSLKTTFAGSIAKRCPESWDCLW